MCGAQKARTHQTMSMYTYAIHTHLFHSLMKNMSFKIIHTTSIIYNEYAPCIQRMDEWQGIKTLNNNIDV